MTAQVDFYVLARAQPEAKYTYACRIANIAYERGLKVYVQTDNPAHSRTLDQLLWTFSLGCFVPIIVCYDFDDGSNVDDNDGSDEGKPALVVERFPVQFGCGGEQEGCVDLLISIKQEAPADYARFGRVAELIIDDDADKSSGRRRFRFYREHGIEPRTHKVSG